MVILVRAYSVSPNGYTGKWSLVEGLRWDNDHSFDFDITVPEHWRVYLASINPPLPRATKEGNAVAYCVYVWGGQYRYNRLFPGKDSEGDPLPVGHYGRLDTRGPKSYKKQRRKSNE